MCTPSCTWCGLPTGNFCDFCNTALGKAVCSECEKDFQRCIGCFRKMMKCSDGEARQHAWMIVRGAERRGSKANKVDPGWANSSVEEKLRMYQQYCLSGGPASEPLRHFPVVSPTDSVFKIGDIVEAHSLTNAVKLNGFL